MLLLVYCDTTNFVLAHLGFREYFDKINEPTTSIHIVTPNFSRGARHL
jgi:hypothetical protein